MDSNKCFCILLQIIISIHCISSDDRKYEPNWSSIDSRPLPQWFDESKIGIFIYWGLYSVPSYGNEMFWWNWMRAKEPAVVDFMAKNYRSNFTYADFGSQFTAELYDPDRWAELFKASGAKYVVLTAKHHEGYTLWPSSRSGNWNSVDVGPNRDLLGDLAKAVRNVSLRFGAHYSLFEWFNPLYLKDRANQWRTQDYVNVCTFRVRPELEELVNTYRPEIIWSNGNWEAPDTYWNSTGFLAWLYNESPVKNTVVVNDRWGLGTNCNHGGFYVLTVQCPTAHLRKFEDAMTLDKTSWGYSRLSSISNYVTIDELISTLAKTVSLGGNLLINIGPTHDGRIAPIFEERLTQLGAWLKINGEAIYSSKPWIHQNDKITQNIWYTSKGSVVYAILLDWPSSDVVLGAIDYGVVDTIQLLGVKSCLHFKKSSVGTQVIFPDLMPDSRQSAYVLRIHTISSE